MADLKDDLPTAMITAAFAGISWYIGIELNVRLFLAGVRQRGLYFWSVLVGSWGVLSQPLVIQLVNFDVWKTSPGSVAAIYLSWSILVVPQSFVLYSRLHLFLDPPKLRWIFYLIAFVSFTFAIPTIIIGTVGVSVYGLSNAHISNSTLANSTFIQTCKTESQLGQGPAHCFLRPGNISLLVVHSRNAHSSQANCSTAARCAETPSGLNTPYLDQHPHHLSRYQSHRSLLFQSLLCPRPLQTPRVCDQTTHGVHHIE